MHLIHHIFHLPEANTTTTNDLQVWRIKRQHERCRATLHTLVAVLTGCRSERRETMGYVAYNLTEASRDALLEKFPPKFENVVCHHVTVRYDVPEDHPPLEAAVLKVIGYALDET